MATLPDTSVPYDLVKNPVDIWNMLAGVKYSLNRYWHFCPESSFIGGRTSVLLATEYRFDIAGGSAHDR